MTEATTSSAERGDIEILRGHLEKHGTEYEQRVRALSAWWLTLDPASREAAMHRGGPLAERELERYAKAQRRLRDNISEAQKAELADLLNALKMR